MRQATAPQPQPPAARGSCRYLDLRLAAGRVDDDRRAQRGFPRRERQVDLEIAALDPVPPVPGHPHHAVALSRGGALPAAAPPPRPPHPPPSAPPPPPPPHSTPLPTPP